MRFSVNPTPSTVPADWLERRNPFLPADDESQPVESDDGTLVAADHPTKPCTKPCCRGES